MHKTTRLKLTEFNNHLTCALCAGYLVDATTIIECLHSYCKTCIVKYLSYHKSCPQCGVQVHKTKPLLNIREDKALQDLVYKLIPGMYAAEMKRRRDFYLKHPHQAVIVSKEQRGEVGPTTTTYSEEEHISISIHLCDKLPPFDNVASTNPSDCDNKVIDSRYLLCPSVFTVEHLKKFIRHKFDLPAKFKSELFHSDEPLKDDYTLMDVAYIHSWRREGPLRLFYIVFDSTVADLEFYIPLDIPVDTPIITDSICDDQQRMENNGDRKRVKIEFSEDITNSRMDTKRDIFKKRLKLKTPSSFSLDTQMPFKSIMDIKKEILSPSEDVSNPLEQPQRTVPRIPKLKIRKVPKQFLPSPLKKRGKPSHHKHAKRQRFSRHTDSPMEVVILPPSPDAEGPPFSALQGTNGLHMDTYATQMDTQPTLWDTKSHKKADTNPTPLDTSSLDSLPKMDTKMDKRHSSKSSSSKSSSSKATSHKNKSKNILPKRTVTPLKMVLPKLTVSLTPKDTSTPTASSSGVGSKQRPKPRSTDKTLFEKLLGELSSGQSAAFMDKSVCPNSPGLSRSADEIFMDPGPTRSEGLNISSGSDRSKDESSLVANTPASSAPANDSSDISFEHIGASVVVFKDKRAATKDTQCEGNTESGKQNCEQMGQMIKGDSSEVPCGREIEGSSGKMDEGREGHEGSSVTVENTKEDTQIMKDIYTQEDNKGISVSDEQESEQIMVNEATGDSSLLKLKVSDKDNEEDEVVDLTVDCSVEPELLQDNPVNNSEQEQSSISSTKDNVTTEAKGESSQPLYNYLNSAMGQETKARPVAAWVNRKEEQANILPRESKLNQAIRKIREKQLGCSPDRSSPELVCKSGITVKATTWVPSIQATSAASTSATQNKAETAAATAMQEKAITPEEEKTQQENKSSRMSSVAVHESPPPHQKPHTAASPLPGYCSPEKKHKGGQRKSSLLEQYCLKNMSRPLLPPPLQPIASLADPTVITNTSKPFSISELTPREIIVADSKKVPTISSLEKLKELAHYHSRYGNGNSSATVGSRKDNDSILQICHDGGSPRQQQQQQAQQQEKQGNTGHSCGKHIPAVGKAVHAMPAQLQTTGAGRTFASHLANLSRMTSLAATSSQQSHHGTPAVKRSISVPHKGASVPLSISGARQQTSKSSLKRSVPGVPSSALGGAKRSAGKALNGSGRIAAGPPMLTPIHPAFSSGLVPTSSTAAGIFAPTRPSPPFSMATSPYPYESYMYTSGGVVMVGSQIKSPTHVGQISQPYSPYARNSISTPSPSSLSPASPVSPGYRTGNQGGPTQEELNNGYDAPLDFSSKKANNNDNAKPQSDRVLLKVPSLLPINR